MPIYEYRCLNCNEEFEAIIFSGDDKVSCPHCNRDKLDKLERLMSACGFKSSGSFTPSSGSSDCSSCSSTNCSSCH